MTGPSTPTTASDAAQVTAWEAPGFDDAPPPEQAFNIDVAGFEGPLDLLLALARTQKVDLRHVSVGALAAQYLTFIEAARSLKLEVAADYLVMAAWLAFLKSRLLLPKSEIPGDEPTGIELAQRLAFRLMRLEAMRNAAAQLMTRHRLGRDVFPRGLPEGTMTIRESTVTAEIYDLLKAYATQRVRTIKSVHVVKARNVWSIKDARRRLETLVGSLPGHWVQLDLFMERYLPSPELTRTVRASSFGATLEMARDGRIDIRQDAAYAPIYMRTRPAEDQAMAIEQLEPSNP